MATNKVVTRIAPSPTGYMHIGTARTALFNYLFARHYGGEFLLRIEDTDQARNTPDAIDALMQGLQWLGLPWDREVVFQSARAARHAEVARELVARGHAYYCYCTTDELAAMRAEAEARGENFMYDRRWRDRRPSEAPAGVAPTIRIKAPLSGETVIEDIVQGRVAVQNSQLDDLILLRADGTPTYLLSVVVDDFDMGVTHVLRGDDHLTNTFRQLTIIKAMGWPEPVYGHIPLIHGDDGKKLSKRRGAVGVGDFVQMGYLPEALANYLCRLGWSHGDDEIFNMQQAASWFDGTHINSGPAQLDFTKLNFVNGHYLKQRPPAELVQLVLPFIPAEVSAAQQQRLLAAMPLLQQRAQTLVEIAQQATMFFDGAINTYTPDALAKLQTPEAPVVLTAAQAALSEHNLANAEQAQAFIQAVLAATGLKMGQAGPVLRAATCGTLQAPDLKDVLAVLGNAEVLVRLQKAGQING